MSPASSPQPPPSPRKTFFGLRRLPPRAAAWLMPLLLSVLMTFVVSLISTLRVVGFSLDLPHLWLSSWALSWVVAFPTLLLVLPVVRRLTAAMVEPPG